ncbi:MAG: helix-turn-helix domain-containing protein [Alphaproteobacteria bacterium]|nr:helix-turn-helix domain-containing protein [Alphaproteobacteria bacterium]
MPPVTAAGAPHERTPTVKEIPIDPTKVNTFLTPAELAERWKVSRGVLANWRAQGKGPGFIRLGPKGGCIVYRLSEVEAYEAERYVAGSQAG